MKVILNTDVTNLGEEGDICNVAPGYARNFLLPQGLVLEDNDRNRSLIEARRADIEARKEAKRKEASTMKERIEAQPLEINMTAGTNGKLFGSVSAATIAEQLAARGIEVERKRIDVPETSIKTVGNFKVRIKLYGDEEATLAVSVSASNAREIEAQRAKEAADAPTESTAEAAAEQGEVTSEAEAEAGDAATLDPEVMAMQAAAEAEAGDEEAEADESEE